MIADLPQLAWPLAFHTAPDGTVTFAEVEQGTPPERKATAALIVATRRGQRLDDPGFGVTQLVFQHGPVNLDRLAAEINQSDPRLDVDTDELLDLADAMRRTVTVSTP